MRLVATCWAKAPTELIARVRKAKDQLDAACLPDALVEARLDLLADPPPASLPAELVRAAGRSLLASCRPAGPGAPSQELERLDLLGRCAVEGAFAVDLEHEEGETSQAGSSLRQGPPLLILSHHVAPEGPPVEPETLKRTLFEMAQRQPDLLKVASPVHDAPQGLALARVATESVPLDMRLAFLPLGPAGRGLRLLAGRQPRGFKRELSALCYTHAGPCLPNQALLGQPSLKDALEVHAVHRLSGACLILGVLGWPLVGTWSPHLHSSLLRHAGLPGLMVPLPGPDLGKLSALLQDLEAHGAAVTAPHKESAAGLVDVLEDRAKEAGSVNTLSFVRELRGASFDGPAALGALQTVGSVKGARVALLGAGGAARALLPELLRAGAAPTVLARREAAASELARHYRIPHDSLDACSLTDFDVLVNATPVGSGPDRDALPVDLEGFPKGRVMDLVTTPVNTLFLQTARAAEHRVVDGLSMLARQAAAQHRLWCMPPGVMGPSDAQVETLLRYLVDAEAGAE